MRRRAKIYVHCENRKYDASGGKSAGKLANYLLRGEENTKKGSIRRDSFWMSQGLSRGYMTSRGNLIKGWAYLEENWLKSKNSSGNKRKKTVKYGAVDRQAQVVFQTGLITLPNDLEVWEAKVLVRRIFKEFPKDCPIMATLHFGKQYEEREEDNMHLHLMMSDRHDFGIGKKAEELIWTAYDKKQTPRIQEIIEEVVRQFYIDFGYEIDEPGTKESIERAIERYEEKLKELENDSSRNKPFKKKYYKDKIEECYEKIVEKKIEEFDREVEEFEKYKELEISGSVRYCREKYKDQVKDSIDKEEEIVYVVDDKINDKYKFENDKYKFEFLEQSDQNIDLKKYQKNIDHLFGSFDDFDAFYDEYDVLTHNDIQSHKKSTCCEIEEERKQILREDEEDKREIFENERLASLGSDVLSQGRNQRSGFKKSVSLSAAQERAKRQYELERQQKRVVEQEKIKAQYEKIQAQRESSALPSITDEVLNNDHSMQSNKTKFKR